jgi:hypothetical protein
VCGNNRIKKISKLVRWPVSQGCPGVAYVGNRVFYFAMLFRFVDRCGAWR